MDEPHQHPARDQLRLAGDHAGEQGAIGLGPMSVFRARFGIVAVDDVVCEQPQRVGVAACREELEGADADMARRDAGQHGTGQEGLADHRFAGRHRRQRARGRDAQRFHRLADDVFAQHGPKSGTAIAAARERRRPRALELDVATATLRVDDLAQQDGAAVAELRREVAELVAGIGERNRLRARRDAVAGEDRRPGRGRQEAGVEAELGGQPLVQLEQPRRLHRRRIESGVEALGQPRVAVVESKGGFAQHGSLPVRSVVVSISRRSSRS